jgi:phosphoserine phosphatase RsbU/P
MERPNRFRSATAAWIVSQSSAEILQRTLILNGREVAKLIDRNARESYSVAEMADPPVAASPHPWWYLSRPLRLALAIVFCAATAFYAVLWMFDARHPSISQVEIGINQSTDTFFDPGTSSVPVFNVIPGSPAAQAGLRAGDLIIALNGHELSSYSLLAKIWSRSRPGDSVDITVRRPGEVQPITVHATFRLANSARLSEGVARTSAREVLGFYPIFFILVGFAVLFLRIDDPDAWLLALFFACFIAAGGNFNNLGAFPQAVRVFALLYRSIFFGLISPIFYIFFALFPERSPLEKRAPWLKWIALGIAVVQILPGLKMGDVALPVFVAKQIGGEGARQLRLALSYCLVVLGLISLVWNCVSQETSQESRRKSRVLLAGTVFGVLPYVFEHILMDFRGYRPPFWVDMGLNLLVFLYPLSFAYAIVKHRVLEIPVLLRRSARYVLVQRGYFVVLFFAALLAIFLFTHFFSGLFLGNSQFAMALSAAFGVAMVWFSGPIVKRGTERIDRAFFRSSYDARMILQDLAEKARTVTNRHELAHLMSVHIKGALQPKSLSCYLEGGDGNLAIESANPKHSADVSGLPTPLFPFRFGAQFILREVEKIPSGLPILSDLARLGKCWDVPPPASDQNGQNAERTPECLVPIVGRSNRLLGLLVLGRRLSEEPYTGEDKYLLESVASQAAVSLENVSMAEQIADRLEKDRRAEREIQIARDVQSRLFPQVMPRLATLEYAGSCIQARQVGGDYYDFLNLGSSHVAFVLADVSGKGIAGALLMANLQANLRSRAELALEDLPKLLTSVNQFFYENTPEDRYATLFFGVYDDATRQLTYANCGQNPPLVFRADGSMEQLLPTATVIGLFPDWKYPTETITLKPNDVLVIYTDGVTEANDDHRHEFGEDRLCATVRKNLQRPPAEILEAIQDAVQKFSVGEQFDDLTLVVARAR